MCCELRQVVIKAYSFIFLNLHNSLAFILHSFRSVLKHSIHIIETRILENVKTHKYLYR